MLKKNNKIFFVTLVFVLVAGCCSAEVEKKENLARGDYSSTKDTIRALIKKDMKKWKITGLSIALVDDQGVVWAEGFGYADQAKRIPATPETIYRAGSISKLFTATAVMQFAEQGKMDIDKPLQTYLPEFSIKSRFPSGGPITPRTLMTHHSGLPTDLMKGMFSENPQPFENLIKELKGEYVANPPNFVGSYSNLGVSLLGIALERVAAQDFASHLDAAVLSPLGMIHSSFSQGPDRSSLASKAYKVGKEVVEVPLRDIPAGGLNTNVHDLSRFIEMVFAKGRSGGKQIIKAETLAEMLRPQNTDVPLDLDWRIGLAWILPKPKNKNMGLTASHSGTTLNYAGQLIVLPEHKLGVVILANSFSARFVRSELANKSLELALEAKTGIKQPESKKEETAVASVKPETLQAYKGRYQSAGRVVKIDDRSDSLRFDVGGKIFRMIAHADDRFYLQFNLLDPIPIGLGDLSGTGFKKVTIQGRDLLIAQKDGEEKLWGEQIEPVAIPPQWMSRTGEYEIINAGGEVKWFENIHLIEDDGLLIFQTKSEVRKVEKITKSLKPVSNTEALIHGLGRAQGETIQVVNHDGEELLQYSGYLLRKKPEGTPQAADANPPTHKNHRK